MSNNEILSFVSLSTENGISAWLKFKKYPNFCINICLLKGKGNFKSLNTQYSPHVYWGGHPCNQSVPSWVSYFIFWYHCSCSKSRIKQKFCQITHYWNLDWIIYAYYWNNHYEIVNFFTSGIPLMWELPIKGNVLTHVCLFTPLNWLYTVGAMPLKFTHEYFLFMIILLHKCLLFWKARIDGHHQKIKINK